MLLRFEPRIVWLPYFIVEALPSINYCYLKNNFACRNQIFPKIILLLSAKLFSKFFILLDIFSKINKNVTKILKSISPSFSLQ